MQKAMVGHPEENGAQRHDNDSGSNQSSSRWSRDEQPEEEDPNRSPFSRILHPVVSAQRRCCRRQVSELDPSIELI